VTVDYAAFLDSKHIEAPEVGFEAPMLPSFLFPFQRETVATALRRGRAAVFAECGLGKTPMQLSWAQSVAEHSARPVLILAPLAVAQQTVREGEKFGIPVRYAPNQDEAAGDIVITNYERLQNFDAAAFGGVVLDESSILKAYTGVTKRRIVEAFQRTPFRLACSATPAPNDHLELGNHSEFLSVLSSHQMIARWFINDMNQAGVYRLKGHAVEDFWDWVSSWATLCALPSDVAPEYSDDGYVLPELRYHTHVIDVDMVEGRDGTLFRMPELSATSIHAERKRTARARAQAVADLVNSEPGEPWIIWTETDYEGDELAAALPEAANLRGSEPPAAKERMLLGFSDGSIRVLISKPKIAGFGLNWQHCARMAFVAATFSFESWYQAVRRCWRFGQTRPVDCHMFMGSTERSVVDVLQSKRKAFEELRESMMEAARRRQHRRASDGRYLPQVPMRVPNWLRSEVSL
jgi:superfamily II DNA or RNA helicase